MGWNWVVHLAQYCRVFVITEGEWRKEIEADLEQLPQRTNLRFYFNPVSPKVRRMCWNQGDWRFYWYYRQWQKRTLRLARDIIAQYRIDVIHQLNMIGFRHPVVWLLFIPLSCAIDALNLPGYSCLVLMYCGLTFLYADNVMHWCHTVRMVWLMIGAVTVNAGMFFGIAGGILQVGHPSYYYATACAGITAFLLLFRMFIIYIRPGRFLCTASTISYELYLVHHLFCLGEYSWFVRWPSVSPLYVSLFVFVASSVGAWFLHEISRRIVLSIQKRCTA